MSKNPLKFHELAMSSPPAGFIEDPLVEIRSKRFHEPFHGPTFGLTICCSIWHLGDERMVLERGSWV